MGDSTTCIIPRQEKLLLQGFSVGRAFLAIGSVTLEHNWLAITYELPSLQELLSER